MAEDMGELARQEGRGKPKVDGQTGGGWVVADFFDVMVHLFSPDVRAFYVPKAPYFALRSLWFGLSGARAQPALGVLADVMKTGAWSAWIWAAFLGGGCIAAFAKRRGRAVLVI